MTATESRTSGSAARTLSKRLGSPATARWQVCPREAARSSRQVHREPLLQLARARRGDQGRARRRGRRRRSAGPAGPAPSRRRRAPPPRAFEPLAAPTAVTRTTRLAHRRRLPREGRAGDGEAIGQRRERRRRDQPNRDLSPAHRDLDCRPSAQPGRAARTALARRPARPPAPAPPPRRPRRQGSGRSRPRAAAARATPASSSAGIAATSSTVACPPSLPIAAAPLFAPTVSARHPRQQARDRHPHGDRARIAHLRARNAATAAAPAAPPPSRRRPPAPPALRPGPPRPPTTAPGRRAPICAATRTASSRKGTTAINSTEAVPSSLWPALLAVGGGTPRPSQPRTRAWRAQARESVTAWTLGVSKCWHRSRSARSPRPRRRAGRSRPACRRRWRRARRCRRSAARACPAPRRGSPGGRRSASPG